MEYNNPISTSCPDQNSGQILVSNHTQLIGNQVRSSDNYAEYASLKGLS